MNIVQPHTDIDSFTDLYSQVREKENRLFSDEALHALPLVSRDHPHAKEWQVRARSMHGLTQYIHHKTKPITVLEMGCGNGWLSHRLSKIQGLSVTGFDIHFSELQQATRVFSAIPNLSFQSGSLDEVFLTHQKYDLIVFAASIQYFKALPAMLDRSMLLLSDGGEIHILDSPFYEKQQLDAARQRTKQYYEELGCPEMAEFYFHHIVDDLNGFACKTLYNQNGFGRLLNTRRNPFPWYCIKKIK